MDPGCELSCQYRLKSLRNVSSSRINGSEDKRGSSQALVTCTQQSDQDEYFVHPGNIFKSE